LRLFEQNDSESSGIAIEQPIGVRPIFGLGGKHTGLEQDRRTGGRRRKNKRVLMYTRFLTPKPAILSQEKDN
jgi:hypothetical protein